MKRRWLWKLILGILDLVARIGKSHVDKYTGTDEEE